MKKWFAKKKTVLNGKQEITAGRIAGRILQAQRKAADYLNDKTALVNGKTWLFLLIGFCALFGSYCLYLLIQAFN